MPDDNKKGDEPESKGETDKKDEQSEDDKPVTVKQLKELLEGVKSKGGDSIDIKTLKEEIKKDFSEMFEPILKNAKQAEFKNSVSEFEAKVKAELPGFSVDIDLLEYQMTMGKTKKEALKVQVDKHRQLAETYGYKKEAKQENKKEEGDIDLNSFDPELHKKPDWRKLKKEEKDSYWEKFSIFKRKNK